MTHLFWPLSQHYGLQETDFDAVPMLPAEAHKVLIQGKVDALFRIIGLGNQAVSELLKSGEIQLLPIDQVEALQLSLPYVTATQIHKGAYDGGRPIPAENLAVVAVNALLATHENVDPAILQTLTRILYEFRNELIAENPRTALIHQPETGKELRLQLFKILRRVVVDLDIDQILPESFQAFTFSWEVAIITIRHQEMMLTNQEKLF